MHDQLSNGEKFRALTVIDVFSREALAIEVGPRMRGQHVVEALNWLVGQRGAPKYLFADNVLTDQSRGSDQTAGLVAPALAGRCSRTKWLPPFKGALSTIAN